MKLIVKKIVLLIVTMGFLHGQVSDRKNMAVYNFAGLGVTNIEAQVISDRIRSEISNLGTYIIIERGMMEQILKEQVLQLSGLCDDASCLVEVGQILAVHYMVGGSVSKIGNLYTIDARIIDVESGEIVISIIEDYSGPIENLLVQTTKIVAGKLSGKAYSRSSLVFTGTSDLFIDSNPQGGTIYINDKPMGDVTPYQLEGLPEGDYKVIVKKDNLIGEVTTSLVRNDRKKLTLNLAKEQFILRINSEPEGAEVTINNIRVGKTPMDYTVTDTTVNYQIQWYKDSYFTHSKMVQFSNGTMLRLTHNLERCGQLFIYHMDDIEVFLNGLNINQLAGASNTGGYQYTPYSHRLTIDQLGFSEYNVRIEKEYHYPYETAIILTPEKPTTSIPAFNLNAMETDFIIESNADGTGELTGHGFKTRLLNLKAEKRTIISLPFGNYSLSAKATGYLPISQDIALFHKDPNPLLLIFPRPDRRLALKRSILFPGMGQIYSHQQKKGLIMAAITGAGMSWFFNSISKYNGELIQYHELEESYKSAMTSEERDLFNGKVNASRELLQSYQNQFQISGSLVAISYTWNILDIIGFYPYE
jgi:TolB-like protein